MFVIPLTCHARLAMGPCIPDILPRFWPIMDQLIVFCSLLRVQLLAVSISTKQAKDLECIFGLWCLWCSWDGKWYQRPALNVDQYNPTSDVTTPGVILHSELPIEMQAKDWIPTPYRSGWYSMCSASWDYVGVWYTPHILHVGIVNKPVSEPRTRSNLYGVLHTKA